MREKLTPLFIMAENVQTYTTRIFLNAEEAKKQLDELQSKVVDLRRKKDEAARAGDWPTFNSLKKQLDKANQDIRSMQTSAQKVDRVLGNLSTASVKELQQTVKAITKELNSGAIERGSEEWKFLNEQLKRCKHELKEIRNEWSEGPSVWQKFFKFLNDSWGGIFVLVQSISGITTTIRGSVQDYAEMEEKMADVRKYTGMSDEAVRDLNEDLKKMDTRTPREELNELAGAAGRLGKESKKDVLDFVEAGNMIKVALGDDLGDGAIDKVGKLAMAFGEDKEKGLRGAMLATGSAINEVSQNSSAQAGYLVDFTARVAGFGKQLGLTQAEIMGFGAVMDENLLRDEMAATAFGNMLTKMQTDTEKFARIAGMDVKVFANLLNNNANAAILALADNLKKADPQNMMKMLDDMGLDGSRAVGVLSTLADKIDDVRDRQELATKAYKEAKSVEDEYNRMNETVEAQIEKGKKAFHEISVELGEKLLPIVKYTINFGSAGVKLLNTLVGVLYDYRATIISTAATIGMLTVYRQKDILWTKLQHFWNDKLMKGLIMLRTAIVNNPWTAAFVAIAAVVGVVIDLIRRSEEAANKTRSLAQAQREQKAVAESMKAVNDEANRSTAEEITRFNQLRKTLEDNSRKYGERKKALEEIKKMVPSYHGTLTAENNLINNNATALDDYVTNLMKAARAQAAFNQMVKIQEDNMKREDTINKRQGNKRWAEQKLSRLGASAATSFKYVDYNVGYAMYDAQGNFVKYVDAAQKKQIEHYQKLIKWNDERISQEQFVLDINQKQSETLQKVVDKDKSGTEKTTPYVSDAERKKQEADRRKREAAERKEETERQRRLKEAEDAAKAESDAKMATLTHEYAMGKIAYRQYIEDMAQLQLEGLQKRRDVYEKGSAEYEKLNREYEERAFKGDQQVNRMKLDDLRRCMLQQQAEIEGQAAREEITEAEKQERLRMLEESFMADKVELYREGSLERMQAEMELQDVEQRNKIERERYYLQQLEQVREQFLGMSNERQLEIALKGLDELHDKGLLKYEEYQRARIAIQAQYADTQTPSEQVQRTANDMLANARKAAAPGESTTPIVGTIQNYQTLMEKLKELYDQDSQNHEAYLQAKRQATADFCTSLASELQAAYQQVNQVMSAASGYFSAQQEYETAMVKKKYEKQIEAAGSNQKKVKKLQEKQAKEEAAIKTKYNKKQMVIQMAQALGQTAVNAIQAYGAGLAVGGPAAPVIAAAFAAMATAAGMLQIAALKKQQQAQEAGYYEGGFTGGHQYRRKAGVVHEGEFVANHQAVSNPAVLPFLNFLDQAQRNNTVGSLTMQDVTRSMGAGGGTQIVAPVVNVHTDNEDLRQELNQLRETNQLLTETLEQGIGIDFSMDSFHRKYKHWLKLNSRG